jgi:glycosyltransferase involved in cell wall biosynthesis
VAQADERRRQGLTLSAEAPPPDATAPRALRVLFFNEGNLGSHILGQGQLEQALRVGLGSCAGVDARFAGLAPMGRFSAALAGRPLPLIAKRGLDPRMLRWHVVQSLRARHALERELRAFRPHVLHLHTQSVAFFTRAITRRLAVVLSVDTTVAEWAAMPAWSAQRSAARETAPSRLLERRAFANAALVAAWTAWARRGVEREQPRANVVEHHPGLDVQRYRPAQHEPRERPRVLFVGGRFAEKGGEDLLLALRDRLGGDVELDLVTPAPVPAREGVRVHRLEPSDPRLLALYQQADVFCLPTYGDTNPWVLLEAMACGAPVVSTPVGAIAEMLDGGRAGVLVPVGDPRALGEAIGSLLGSPGRLAELRRAGRERCERHYDARRQFATLVQLMRSLSG